jgi:hypothetical protein
VATGAFGVFFFWGCGGGGVDAWPIVDNPLMPDAARYSPMISFGNFI